MVVETQVRPNPDEVLGVDWVEQPFDANKTPRWEDPKIQPILIYEADEKTDDINDLG